MPRSRFIPLLPLLCASLIAAVPQGTHIESLTAGPVTYTDVTVRSVNAVNVVLTHSGGLASVPLSTLSPDWQARFDYDPAAASTAIRTTRSRPAVRTAPPPAPKLARPTAVIGQLLHSLDIPPKLHQQVDLRRQFFDFGLYPKDQGRRPSCSVFAVVSALEYQNAVLLGQPEKFSEEYLIWATRKVLGHTAPADLDTTSHNPSDQAIDAGFSLVEVVTALRTYGVPRQADMPNTVGQSMSDIPEPNAALITRARTVRNVSISPLPGRSREQVLPGLIHALNAEVPPVIALRWPNERAIRNGFLSLQQPVAGYSHAVTLVGYRCVTGKLEDTIFIFKNSWGPRWGQGGFGNVTYGYLLKNLEAAVVLDVQTARN